MVTEFFNKNNFANLKSDKSDVRPAWDQTRTIDDRLRIKRSFFKPILDLGSKILFSGKFFQQLKISILFGSSDNEVFLPRRCHSYPKRTKRLSLDSVRVV